MTQVTHVNASVFPVDEIFIFSFARNVGHNFMSPVEGHIYIFNFKNVSERVIHPSVPALSLLSLFNLNVKEWKNLKFKLPKSVCL